MPKKYDDLGFERPLSEQPLSSGPAKAQEKELTGTYNTYGRGKYVANPKATVSRPKYRYFWTWTCHLCIGIDGIARSTGMSTKLNPKCLECNHTRCTECKLEEHVAPPDEIQLTRNSNSARKFKTQLKEAEGSRNTYIDPKFDVSRSPIRFGNVTKSEGLHQPSSTLTTSPETAKARPTIKRNHRSRGTGQKEDNRISELSDTISSISPAVTTSSASSPQDLEGDVEKLVSLLLGDNVISSLCAHALNTIAKGSFERNLMRLLSTFGAELEKDSRTRQEHHFAQLVEFWARESAQLICNNLQPTEAKSKPRSLLGEDLQLFEESDSGSSENCVNDVPELESFIKNSKALEALKAKLRAFIDRQMAMENDLQSEHLRGDVRALGLNSIISWALYQMKNSITGLHMFQFRGPEPVEAEKGRIEWQCACGEMIFDNYRELQGGALGRFQQSLNHSIERNVPVQSTAFQKITEAFSSPVQSICSLLGFTSFSERVLPGLPLHQSQQHYDRTDTSSAQTETSAAQPSDLLFLLLCYSADRHATRLLQLVLASLEAKSDKLLFQVLRVNYQAMRGHWVAIFSLRTLKSIKFVHFDMYGEHVEVREQDAIPPPGHTEYIYQPVPPKFIPPVGENRMMHLFNHPDHAFDEPFCLDRFPKKLKEKLKCNGGFNPGWGLQFVEGWDSKRIWVAFFIIFGLGSLFMGCLWS